MTDLELLPAVSHSLVLDLSRVPALFRDGGERAAHRFIEFFTANIRNRNTRQAYARAVAQFACWCDAHQLALRQLTPFHVAAYVEHLGQQLAKPSVKQHLAAVRILFDWLVTGQIVPHNPVAAVRGPTYVIKKGKTPVLTRDEARAFFDAIDTRTIAGLRDRALIGVMVYSFARVGAVLGRNVEDYYLQGKRWWLRLNEKGGKHHELPAHHKVEDFLDAYLTAAGIAGDKATPLFRSVNARRQLTDCRLLPRDALAMVKRRARAAGLGDRISCHTFRATGITLYLLNQGTLERAQQIAAHESPRTTKLYDRTCDQVSLDEIEKILI
jgi:integrase/recombinase XerD